MYEMNWAKIFPKSSVNPIFGLIFDRQRAENEARNTKMYRGHETHPIRINARYEMNWANSFFTNVLETPFSAKYWANSFLKKFRKPHFDQILGHQRAENEARNTEMYRV